MKLDKKKTFLIGLAFLSINVFWQAYDFVVPLILKNRFDMGEGASGIIMAMDNILALFLLPFFGALSDRCTSRMGRRMPFIVFGTAAACILMMILPGVVSAGSLPVFIVILGLLLFSMGTYRSPAVALMPDLTPRPLRSKGNAVINLMGALGSVYTLVMIQLLASGDPATNPSYYPLFISVAGLMVISVGVLFVSIPERRLLKEMSKEEEEKGNAQPGGKLEKGVLRSLILILMSVFFWFMGYNAVSTWFSTYYTHMWGETGGAASCLMIATIGAVASYIPVGMISSKLGRKKVILAGVALLTTCFALATFVRDFNVLVYVLFVLVGVAWAAINVNSFPMVVEISRGADVGKYTGYYYTFSMTAQIATPMVSGWLIELTGYHLLFPYAAVMAGISFVTMMLTRHGDSKPEKPASRLEALDAGD